MSSPPVSDSQSNRDTLVQVAESQFEYLSSGRAGGAFLYESMPLDIQASVLIFARSIYVNFEDLDLAASVGAAVLVRTSDLRLFNRIATMGRADEVVTTS